MTEIQDPSPRVPSAVPPMPVGAPTRVLFIDHTAKLGGGEIALLNLVQHLHPSTYFPVVLLFSDGPLRAKLEEEGIETHILPVASDVLETRKDSLGLGAVLRLKAVVLSIRHAIKVRRFIANNNIGLVHTNSLKADIIGGIAARLAGVPTIWHIRDRIESDYLPRPVVWVFRHLCRIVPDFVIANSAATLRTLALPSNDSSESVPSGIESRRIRVVHDGTAPVPSSTNRAAERPVIGLIGRLSPWKGQHIFIAAAALVRERFPLARFQIIGSAMFSEDNYEKQIREQVQTLGLSNCVEFLGFRDDIPAIVASLDVLVHASTTGEPFGQVVIEGMAAGKPVVATNGGGIPEIVVDGVTGLLVPMNDVPTMATAISRLLQDKTLCRAMGRLGRQRVLDHFTIEFTAERVESVYDKILAKSPAERSMLQKLMRSLHRRDHADTLPSHGTFLRGQLIAATLVASGVVAHFVLSTFWGLHIPAAVPFFPVVAIAAWLTGISVGLEATLASALLILLFNTHASASTPAAAEANRRVLMLFLATSTLVIMLVEQLHSVRRRNRHARIEQETEEKNIAFLTRASESLALAPDTKAVLTTLAYLANSKLCDWCIVDLVRNASLERAMVAHRNPQLDAIAEELQMCPPHSSTYQRLASATDVSSLAAFSRSADIIPFNRADASARMLAHSLGMGSHAVIPLVADGRAIGTLTLVRRDPVETFADSEIEIAEALGSRAADALDRAQPTAANACV